MPERISIVSGADQAYFPGLLATVFTALASSARRGKFEFFIFDGGIQEDSKAKLEQLLGHFGNQHGIKWLAPQIDEFEGLPSMNGNYLTYARLAIPKLVDRPRVIWLDSDLLVFSDCEELWSHDIGEGIVAAALEVCEFGQDVCHLDELGIPANAPYFNAGVLLMDVERLSQFQFTERALRFLAEHHGHYNWHDQSAINVVLHNQVSQLPRRFNYLNRIYLESPENGSVESNSYNYHFLERPKPWQRYNGEPHSILFYEIMKLLDQPLPELASRSNRINRLKWRFPKLTSSYYAITPRRIFKKTEMETWRSVWRHNARLKQASGTCGLDQRLHQIQSVYQLALNENTVGGVQSV